MRFLPDGKRMSLDACRGGYMPRRALRWKEFRSDAMVTFLQLVAETCWSAFVELIDVTFREEIRSSRARK